MGACASRFTMVKSASTAPPPEVESKEVNLAEELVVKKDDAQVVEDEADRRQSLGHLLKEGEEKKGTADSNGKASEDVKQDDATEVKPESVADASAVDETEKAPVADGLKPESLEEEVLACQNVATEAEKIEEKAAEIVKLDRKEEVETLKTEKPEENKAEKEEKTAEVTKCKASDKAPEAEALETEKTEEQKPASDAEKKETEEKSTETAQVETPVKKHETPEVTVECKPASEAEKEKAEEKPIEKSDKKPEPHEADKTEQKQAVEEEKPVENTKIETSEQVEDKHVLEQQKTENCSDNKTPASDAAAKPKAEEEKANAN